MSELLTTLKSAFLRHKLAIIVAFVGLFIYFLPFVILGSDSYIRVHDNLDSEILFNQLVIKYFWQLKGTATELANIDIGSINTFNYTQLIFYAVIPPFAAYVANDLLVRLTAYIGMYVFLGVFGQKLLGKALQPLNATIALLFALLPFYTVYGLTSAGMPLLILAFYWISHRQNILLGYALAVYYTLSSSVILSGYFVLIVLFVLCCRYFFQKTRWQYLHFYIASFIVFVLYVLMYTKVIVLMTTTDFVSHRAIWGDIRVYNQIDSLWLFFLNTLMLLFYGHYHVGSAHSVAVAGIIAAGIFALVVRRRAPHSLDDKLWRAYRYALYFNIILVLVNNLLSIKPVVYLTTFLGPLESFNFGRLFFIQPLSVYVSFAISALLAYDLAQHKLHAKPAQFVRRVAIATLVIVCFGSFSFSNGFHSFDSASYLANYPLLVGQRVSDRPTYKEFVDHQLFGEIDRAIGRPKDSYRVASLGIFPSAASMNGFYTIDGYMQNYSLEYWQAFRKIIADELKKSPTLDDYFTWGNRCFLFANDIGKQYYLKKDCGMSATVDYNIEALKELGGEYIFSAVPINNAQEIGLELLGIFEHSTSYWRIHLYGISATI